MPSKKYTMPDRSPRDGQAAVHRGNTEQDYRMEKVLDDSLELRIHTKYSCTCGRCKECMEMR